MRNLSSFTYTTTGQQSNLNLRQYYAGQALMGFVSGCPWTPGDLQDPTVNEMIFEVAKLSVLFADAIIKELEK